MTIPSEPRTPRLYHAGSGSAFPLSVAVGIVMAAFASFLVAAILVFNATRSPVLGLVAGQLMFAVIAIGAMVAKKLRPVALGVTRPRGVFLGAAVLIGVSLWYVNLRIVTLIELPEGGIQQLQDIVEGPPLVVVLLALAVLPAICEELLFRGLLLRALATRFAPAIAVLISAVVFAGYHMSLVQLIPTFTLGLVAGAVTLRAHSVVPAMVAHLLNNGIAIVITRVPDAGSWIDDHPALSLVTAVMMTASGVAIATTVRRTP
ncbi:MAG: Abortive infection protein [Myxococcales bacterium]|nr:Abortive infection protein [Myxococcales bacterium]